MKWIIAAATALLAITAAGPVTTGTPVQAADKIEVSEAQYQALLSQCRYSNTAQARAECRARVKATYRVGKESNPNLDCRKYSSIRVCGTLELSRKERECVRYSMNNGETYRRAEVECYAFS
jgi:hypothetical protein